jgi:hypothetical protein
MAGVYDPRNPNDPYQPYHGPAQVNRPTQPPRLPLSGKRPGAKRVQRVSLPDDTDDLVWPNPSPSASQGAYPEAYTVPDMSRVAQPPVRPPANRRRRFPIPLFPPQAAPARRARTTFQSRALRWVALTVVVAILGVFVYAWVTAQQNGSPTGAVTQFCAALRADQYSRAYNLLASAPRNRMSSTQFANAAAALDRIEGRVTGCPSTPESAVQIGVNAATVDAALTRAGLGPMRGKIGLAHEQNAWRISSLDPALLGVSLDALVAANNFCATLQGQRYADTYTALDDSLRGGLSAADFEQVSQWSDLVDGTINSCAPVTVDSSGGESAATMAFSVTRARLGKLRGDIALVNANGVWKVKSVANTLQGTDLGALVMGQRYCADLASNNQTDLATQVTAGYVLTTLGALLVAGFKGESWTGCSFDVSTFKLNGDKASYKGVMQVTAKDKTTRRAALTFGALQASGAWKMDTLTWA